MEVKINREIRDYTETMFFGLSLRQFIFSVLACGVAVGVLAKGMFEGCIDVPDCTVEKEVKVTEQLMEDGHKVIAEASFKYKDFYCRVDILEVTDRPYAYTEDKSYGYGRVS